MSTFQSKLLTAYQALWRSPQTPCRLAYTWPLFSLFIGLVRGLLLTRYHAWCHRGCSYSLPWNVVLLIGFTSPFVLSATFVLTAPYVQPLPLVQFAPSVSPTGFAQNDLHFITTSIGLTSQPQKQTGQIELIHWDFDQETDTPRIPDGVTIRGSFYSVGVKRAAYASGSPGKAASASQWTPALGSAWIIRFSTSGYEQLRLNAKQYSSATGPAAFHLHYSLDSLLWKPLAEVALKSSFASNFTSEGLALPAELNHREKVWIRWQVKSPTAVNGNTISAAGTSRIDEISLKGFVFVQGLAELPNTPSSELTLTTRTDSSLSLRWKPGSGYRRLVIGLRDSLQRCTPSHQISYDPASEDEARRTLVGGCPVLYNGGATQYHSTSLKPLSLYGYAIIEYNGLPGREHYRWQDAPRVFVKTRAKAPKAAEAPTIAELTIDEAYLRPPITAPADLRLVFSTQAPTPEQQLSLEKDRYVSADTTGLSPVVAKDTLIRIPRSATSLLPLWYWTVSGPPGDRSPQQELPDSIMIPWPHLQPSGLMALWTFDQEQLLPETSYPDFEASGLEVTGAAISGFTTGYAGKAVSLNQWSSGLATKAWSIHIPSIGLDRLTLAFRIISSASGPFRFRFECRVQNKRLFQGGVYEAAADWKSSRLHQIELPAACMQQVEVQLALVLADTQARNGLPISNSGTLRLDQVSLEGSYREHALPLLLPPQITRLDDHGVLWSAQLGSTAGKMIQERYVELRRPPSEQVAKPVLESLVQRTTLPLIPRVTSGTFTSLTPGSPHSLQHCVSLNGSPVCSPKTVFTTPYAIPPRPEPYALSIHENDSISLHIDARAQQLWMTWTSPEDPMPSATDSLTVFCSPGTPCVAMDTLSTGNPYGRGRLQPGQSYRLWVLASNGSIGRHRYSRPPHAYLDIRMPPLPPPTQGIRELVVAEQTFDQLLLRWQSAEPLSVLVLACPDSLDPARPQDDLRYSFDARFTRAGRIGAHTYVLYDGEATDLRVFDLPLQTSWSLIVVPYAARHGAVSYAWEHRTRLKVQTFPDPRRQTITAREMLAWPLDTPFHTLGTVLWQDAASLILRTRDGNFRLEHPSGRWKLRAGDSLAVRAMRQTGGIQIQYLLNVGTSRSQVKPFTATAAHSRELLESKALLALGNVLGPAGNQVSVSSELRFWQRGAPRRALVVTGPDKVLSALYQTPAPVQEGALIGIPLLQPGHTMGKVAGQAAESYLLPDLCYDRAESMSGSSSGNSSNNISGIRASALATIVGANTQDAEREPLRLWIPDTEHHLPYTARPTPLRTPNLNQIFSWSSQTDDTISFSWQPFQMVRPYDQYPDSVQRQWQLRIRHQQFPSMQWTSTNTSTTTLDRSARELFTSLAPRDSLGAILEWSVVPYVVSHHHGIITLPTTPWQSFLVYRLRVTGLDTDDPTSSGLPTHWKLSPAYPNPFNPVTQFKLSAPRPEPISLRVYDSLGRYVQQLFEGSIPTGEHHFVWDAASQPSGVYFIRLISPRIMLTRAVTVIR